ncbi:class I adenylate-forming enzyme family protein [Variovorax sp. DT-64]|uniref:class I adenylate-forming enzyme family protein n=1 Tax=Variovorax sp. DT-64 TaxID=3396160 RepID=UPI003F1A6736
MTTAPLAFPQDWAESRPGAIAVVDGDTSLTWKELEQRGNSLAHALLKRGVTASDVIVSRMHNRHEWVILVVALAKIGATMVGMNWRLTVDECRHQLENSGASVFFCDDADPAQLSPAWAGLALKLCVSVDVPFAGMEMFQDLLLEEGPPIKALRPPGLIIYTSGTTGRPKGVLHQARDEGPELQAYQASLQQYRRNFDNGVALVTMPVHHGSGPSQIWAAIHRANKIVLMRRFDPEATLKLIQEHRIDLWTAVPTMLKRISALPPETLAKYDVSSISILSVGGSPVPADLKDWILTKFPKGCLQEGYGVTEVGMVSALTPEMHYSRPGSCGLPHGGVSIRVRDAAGSLLGPGATGEIWVKSPHTIRSYHNEPPLGPDVLDEDGYFRTGDVGHQDADGYLYITDRVKDLIISGGVNIYPAEIEAALRKHPAVLDAAAIGIPDEEFGEQVHAFCELRPGAYASQEELLAACAAHLASYKRPRRIEVVSELPRNTMGKVLKRELRAPFWQGRQRAI